MKPIHPQFYCNGSNFRLPLNHSLILRHNLLKGRVKYRVKATMSSLLMCSEHLRACAVSRMLTCTSMLTIRNRHKSYHKHHVMGESDTWSNYEHHLHRVCKCWSIFCLCEGQKVCALTTGPLVVPNCSEEENVQRCISSGFTPCAELVSFSAIRVFDAHTATTKGGEWWLWFGIPSPIHKRKVGRVAPKILSPEWNWLQHWDWKTDQLKRRTWSCLLQWQQNYIPYQIHTTVQLQQRWKEANKTGSQQ